MAFYEKKKHKNSQNLDDKDNFLLDRINKNTEKYEKNKHPVELVSSKVKQFPVNKMKEDFFLKDKSKSLMKETSKDFNKKFIPRQKKMYKLNNKALEYISTKFMSNNQDNVLSTYINKENKVNNDNFMRQTKTNNFNSNSNLKKANIFQKTANAFNFKNSTIAERRNFSTDGNQQSNLDTFQIKTLLKNIKNEGNDDINIDIDNDYSDLKSTNYNTNKRMSLTKGKSFNDFGMSRTSFYDKPPKRRDSLQNNFITDKNFDLLKKLAFEKNQI